MGLGTMEEGGARFWWVALLLRDPEVEKVPHLDSCEWQTGGHDADNQREMWLAQ